MLKVPDVTNNDGVGKENSGNFKKVPVPGVKVDGNIDGRSAVTLVGTDPNVSNFNNPV